MSKVTKLVSKEREKRRKITESTEKNLLGIFVGHKEEKITQLSGLTEDIEKVKCISCDGSGLREWNESMDSYTKCNNCEGTGYVYYNHKKHKIISNTDIE